MLYGVITHQRKTNYLCAHTIINNRETFIRETLLNVLLLVACFLFFLFLFSFSYIICYIYYIYIYIIFSFLTLFFCLFGMDVWMYYIIPFRLLYPISVPYIDTRQYKISLCFVQIFPSNDLCIALSLQRVAAASNMIFLYLYDNETNILIS